MSDELNNLLEYQSCGLPLRKAILVVDPEHDDPAVIAFIDDVELDVFLIKFDPEGVVEFVVDDLTYLSLDSDTLAEIVELIDDAEEIWESLQPFWKDDGWSGWEHLAYARTVN